MSGAEVIGVISGIIAIVDATVKVYDAATDASGLPETFRDVRMRLPLVQETLQTARKYLENTKPDAEFCKAMEPVLEDCADKVTRLKVIFEKVIPHDDVSRMERYSLVVRTLFKGDTVESLMQGILVDIQLLTGNRVTKLPTEYEIADLIQGAIEALSAMPPSLPNPESSNSDAERNALIKNLRWIDPTLDRDRIERTKGGLFEEASRWILAHPSYEQWQNDETNLLWIRGGAGKGKTMLMVAITKALESSTKLGMPGADSFLSFFFCQNTDDRLNNAVAILKGLICMLLIQDSSLISYLKNHYDRMGKEAFDLANNAYAFDVLSNVFRRMIAHPRSEKIYLAVDALDECEEGLPGLLGLIRETCLQENHVKWIVTSRNHVNVDDSLALSLEVNSAAVLRAIKVYIEHKISQVPSLKSNTAQRLHVQQKLFDKADGTFLWVDLVLQSIRGAFGDDIIQLIDEVPKGLPSLYDKMMRSIGMPTSAYKAPCLTTLSIVTLAYRPLHLLELRMLAGLERFDAADMEKIVDMCGSFLTLLDSHIYPIHQSAKDYLVSDAAFDKIFPSGIEIIHRDIVIRSVTRMSKVLRRDVYDLVHPGTLIHEVKLPPVKDPLLGLGYSCVYWIDHVCEIYKNGLQKSQQSSLRRMLKHHLAPSKKDDSLHNLIVEFFHVHFLHWLEALSLLRFATSGVFALTRLRDIRTTRDKVFVDFIEDAYRFILHNRFIIEQAPLQTYISALLFTPVNSITRLRFTAQEPSWVMMKPVVENYWSQCLQTCEGHSSNVNSVALSQDGSRIASGSLDKTIRIWNAKSGKEILKLEGHERSVLSVAFSQDGSRIVSGSRDKSIRIWDTTLGKDIQKLEGHGRGVSSVAFSNDGSRIVSGSDDNTIRIWDVKSGKELRKLEGHSSDVSSAVFSADDSRIVSGSDDKTVRIWDVNSGKELRKLEGHSKAVSSAMFSRDGNRIVSGSDDKTVRIWDVKSGKDIRKLEGHRRGVLSVAFSQDGSHIISGSNDKTVRIWDVKSGKDIRKLEGHGGSVSSVVISQDGSRIVSGSTDETIRIWDNKSVKETRKLDDRSKNGSSAVFSQDLSRIGSGSSGKTARIWGAKPGKDMRKFEGHRHSVRSVAFSHDDSRIVSGSLDETIRIWDVNSGMEVRNLKGHRNVVPLVLFSQDGNRIVSGSADKTVRIWDAKSGKEVCKFERPDSNVSSIALSQDGSHIASGSGINPIIAMILKAPSVDMDIMVWDIKSGNEVLKLTGHRGVVSSLTFSQDDSRIASGSKDKTIRIWDAKSGKEIRKLKGHAGVSSVAFSQDDSLIAAGLEDKTVHIWDAISGNKLHTICTSHIISRFEFETSIESGVRLRTNVGHILDGYRFSNMDDSSDRTCSGTRPMIEPNDQPLSDQSTSSDGTYEGWGLNADNSWITWCGRGAMWLPLDFRSKKSDVSRDGSTIVIGYPTGRMMVIKLSFLGPIT